MTNEEKLVEIREAHKSLWDWLAANPWKEKEDWPGWSRKKKVKKKYLGLSYTIEHWFFKFTFGELFIPNMCFCCLATGFYPGNAVDDENRMDCRFCPITWTVKEPNKARQDIQGNECEEEDNAEYEIWNFTNNEPEYDCYGEETPEQTRIRLARWISDAWK